MDRIAQSALAGFLCLCLLGCGVLFVGGSILVPSTVHGTVTSVQVGNVPNGPGNTVQVTSVTFFQNGSFTTVGFCQDQSSQFFLNQSVSVNFNPGQFCSALVVVIRL